MISDKNDQTRVFPSYNYFKPWAIVGVRKKVYCSGHRIYNTYELGRTKNETGPGENKFQHILIVVQQFTNTFIG